jgi:hypothetical protein
MRSERSYLGFKSSKMVMQLMISGHIDDGDSTGVKCYENSALKAPVGVMIICARSSPTKKLKEA